MVSGIHISIQIRIDKCFAGNADEGSSSPAQALESYHGVMSNWVEAALSDADMADVFSVAIPTGKTVK